MKKVLFILKKRLSYGSYGISYGLINSSKFVAIELNKMTKIEAKVIEVVDNNQIDKEVAAYKPDIVIIEALWVVPEKMPILIKLHPKVKWIVRLHSKPAFIANEGIAMDWITKYIEIGKETGKLLVSGNNKEFSDYLSKIFRTNVVYSPNIYPEVFRECYRKVPEDNIVDIGCFGALRPMKNHLSQALAAIAYAKNIRKKLRFHINSDRVEQRGEQVLTNLRKLFEATPNTELVEHPWREHADFLKLAAKMDLGMQVSHSETYNIVAADLVSLGVPVLVSSEIDWAPNLYMADPNSLTSIEKGLYRLNVIENPLLTYWAKLNLARSNDKALLEWKKLIYSI